MTVISWEKQMPSATIEADSTAAVGARFTALWIAASATYLAAQIVKFALPLFAAEIDGSPLPVAGVSLAMTAPWLLFGLVAGALVDRFDRRLILLGVNGVRLAAILPLVLAAATDHVTLPLLYAIALVLGTGDTFTETTTTTIIPMLVPPERLDRANARLYSSQTFLEIVALPLGGALAAIGLTLTAGAGGLCYALAIVALLGLRGSYRPARTTPRHLVAEIVEGLRFLRDYQTLRTITIMAAVINACWSAWGAIFVLYAVKPGPVGLSAFGYGLLLTAAGVGGFCGSVTAARLQERIGRRWAIGINIAVNAVMFGGSALTANPWLLALALVIGDFGGPLWGIATLGLQARSVPDRLRGRVSGAYRFVSFGSMALGSVLGGAAAEGIGIRGVFAACAVITALMLIPFVRVITEATMGGR